ncbi:Uncharacterized protein Fot_03392 [Forsythia ovata]|uniref:Uncharacterized protein n=1 Tax=Forsythia ovata TaxID=205694 RepID=A0ABD1XCL5_9LAMI
MDNRSQNPISNYAPKQIKITKEHFQNHNFLHIQTRYGVWTMEASIKYQTRHRSKSRLQKNSSRTQLFAHSNQIWSMDIGSQHQIPCTEANQDYKRTIPEPQLFAHPN